MLVPPLLRGKTRASGRFWLGQSISLLGDQVPASDSLIATAGALAGVLWLLPSPMLGLRTLPEAEHGAAAA